MAQLPKILVLVSIRIALAEGTITREDVMEAIGTSKQARMQKRKTMPRAISQRGRELSVQFGLMPDNRFVQSPRYKRGQDTVRCYVVTIVSAITGHAVAKGIGEEFAGLEDLDRAANKCLANWIRSKQAEQLATGAVG